MINVNLNNIKTDVINSDCLLGLTDIRDVCVNSSLPVERRIEKFIEDVKNPYQFRVGKTMVRVQYNSSSCSLQTKMEEFLCQQTRLKN